MHAHTRTNYIDDISDAPKLSQSQHFVNIIAEFHSFPRSLAGFPPRGDSEQVTQSESESTMLIELQVTV